MPSAVCVTCSKNEGDIVESFVRYNASYIDKFCFIDESTDNTVDILRCLQREGFDIDILGNPSAEYRQDVLVNSALHSYLESYDYYFCLDVDEILECNDLTRWRHSNPKLEGTALRMYWNPYVPISLNFGAFDYPLKEGFRSVLHPKVRIQKVAFSNELARKCWVGVGSHNLVVNTNKGYQIASEKDWCFSIAHFPVRTEEQLISKIVRSGNYIRLKESKAEKEGHHVLQILAFIKERKYRLSLCHLKWLAANYGVEDLASQPLADLIKLGDSFNREDVEIKYKPEMSVNLTNCLGSQIDEYVDRILQNK